MRFIFLGIFVAMLVGCVGTPPPNYTATAVPISFPNINEVTTVSLGEDMLRQGFYTEEDGIELRNENNIQNYKLSPGFYPQISEDKDHTYHSFQLTRNREGLGHIPPAKDILGFPMGMPQSIRAKKTKQETCVVIGGLSGASCDTEHAFFRVKRPVLSDRDLQQTLIYSGRIGDRIRLGYRESSGSVARPAFSNEAEYDLSSSMEIAYRGARIRVLEADNQKIRYVVIANFNSD